jgi:hypothetical protein
VGKKEPSYTVDEKQYGGCLKKLKTELPHDLAIALLGTYLKECKSGYNKDP